LPAVVLALVLAGGVTALRWTPARTPVVDAGDLAADPETHLGSEVAVTGEWIRTGPSQRGYVLMVLRGRESGRVLCHFEDVPIADRTTFEARLNRPGKIVVRGRCDGIEDGRAVLRGCTLLD
jgi:hypothetical protein